MKFKFDLWYWKYANNGTTLLFFFMLLCMMVALFTGITYIVFIGMATVLLWLALSIIPSHANDIMAAVCVSSYGTIPVHAFKVDGTNRVFEDADGKLYYVRTESQKFDLCPVPGHPFEVRKEYGVLRESRNIDLFAGGLCICTNDKLEPGDLVAIDPDGKMYKLCTKDEMLSLDAETLGRYFNNV